MTYPQLDFSTLNVSEKQESSNFLEKEKRLKKIYEITVKTRNFEIAQLIQRNNFFMIFQGVLLACVISSKDTVPFVQFIISCAGFYIAYCQTKVAAGAKFWQEYWESEVYKAEKQLEALYKNNSLLDGKKINTNFQLQSFIPLFIKSKEQVYSQVSERLLKTSPTTETTSPLYITAPPIKINRYIKLLFSGETLKPSIFSTNKLILEKPSVSKIPIHVGQCLIITWALLMLSCLGVYNKILEWKPINDIALRGFPTHKEAIKQEIYLSNDKDKTSALYLANDHERNTDNAISGSTIPLQVDLGRLHNLSQNNEIFLNIHIDKNGNATTSYKISDSDLETKK
ncbi:hypothetical protein GPS63_00500 [Acinetobacter haemolyticus]|uniref:RipA family octameric membrane protein n=1 Tax=Acinetobacter haemolyticus TaxID=29430 RepID=UPI001331C690|nr:hypothetical protein [Acinetobacter haemolyticus]NAR16805.1 hypothetical protein [Acinetobacter haemolyticus]NAR34961.1 hypothetical protein [Acinetobacter haemolyticus]NAR46255.1 hypothetical protein [Acinetobacter haemolyticus]QHI19122.1 hypothetical protein AhaeAN3_03725 [Acinetobacter haemolyticus]